MRLSNRRKTGLYTFLNTLLVMSFVLGTILWLLEKYKYHYLGWSSSLFLLIPLLFGLIFYLRGRQIFEYDSDGEALNFKNRNVFRLFAKAVSDEFPKYKLKNYEVLNALLFKKLYITVSSKKNSALILKYDISYLTKKELSDLKLSLSKVIKTNKERE
ncbi:hypothetical protein [Kaistella palustris]|uniref:hypothetical protein n=1 Tax=Kaistella palustris TaxID=493376 RepID=UPI000481C6E3|nr:hypothetical protein [Kaistella palustris]